MGGKTAVVAGLLAGAIVGVAVVGATVALLPVASPALPTPTPVAATPSASPSSTPSASPAPSSSAPGASSSPSSSASTSPSPASSGQGASPSPAASAGTTGFGVGQAAPALSVPKVGGGTIDLASLRGKPVWINFMASWCPPCQDELPLMNGFAARYAGNGLVIVLVDVREDEPTVGAFLKSLNVTLPAGLDLNGAAQQAWKAIALPVHFWIDANGIVRAGAAGSIGPDVMAANLQTILPGVSVTP